MEQGDKNTKATQRGRNEKKDAKRATSFFSLANPDDAPYKGYKEYLRHPRFQSIRREAMEKVGWKCQKCQTARATQVHHLRYPPWGTFDVIENLLPVCYKCHCEIHGKEK